MKRLALLPLILIVLLSIAAIAGDKEKDPFTSAPASSYPGHQTLDKITIAAVPFTSDEQAASAFGKVRPYKYGILPVLVVIQNDTGKALRLNLTTQFVDSKNRRIDAMPASDVVLFDGGNKTSWKTGSSPSPLPLPRKQKHGPLYTPEIEGLAFSAKLAPSGESVRGFFYFQSPNEPGAKLYVTGIKDAASGKDYFYFEVPFEDSRN
jgi:hypothetical protein